MLIKYLTAIQYSEAALLQLQNILPWSDMFLLTTAILDKAMYNRISLDKTMTCFHSVKSEM